MNGSAGILAASALLLLYAAVPPDVRKVCDLPECTPSPVGGSAPFFIFDAGHSPNNFLLAGRSQTFRTSGGKAARATVAGHIVDPKHDGHSTSDEKGHSFRIVNLSGCSGQLNLLSPSRYPSRAGSTNANIGTRSANCTIARPNNPRKHGRHRPSY